MAFDCDKVRSVDNIGDLHLNSDYSYIYVIWSKTDYIWDISELNVLLSFLVKEGIFVENCHSISMLILSFRYLWSGISMVIWVRYLWQLEVDHSLNIYFSIFQISHVRSLCHGISMFLALLYLWSGTFIKAWPSLALKSLMSNCWAILDTCASSETAVCGSFPISMSFVQHKDTSDIPVYIRGQNNTKSLSKMPCFCLPLLR